MLKTNMRTLEAPATTGEAITIRRALNDEETANVLRDRFGETAVTVTHDNAMNWLYAKQWAGYDESDYTRHEPREWIIHAPTQPDGEALMEETEIDARPDPVAFDVQQSKIILAAMRRTIGNREPHQLENAKTALDYLAQRSPNRLERVLSRAALNRLIAPPGNQRLLHYMYARITRGRNRSHRLAATAAGSYHQIRDAGYRQELPERA